MQVTLICFSLTGNTLKIADAMSEALHEAKHSVRTYSLEQVNSVDLSRSDLIGVGSACHSSKAPAPVIDYLESLPKLDNLNAFVFATCGGASGRVLSDLARPLRSRGANIIGEFLAFGEVHHPAPSLIGRLPGRPNGVDFAQARHFAISMISRLANPGFDPHPQGRAEAAKPHFGFYDIVAAMTPDTVMRTFMPEPQLAQSRCDLCRLCVRACPISNISLKPYPVIGDQCIRCYCCYTICPREAFWANWRFGDLLVRCLYNTAFVRWFGDLKSRGSLYSQRSTIGAIHG